MSRRPFILRWPRLVFAILFFLGGQACNEPSGPGRGNDARPGTVVTPPADTAAVKTTPPTGDSNAINVDSNRIAR